MPLQQQMRFFLRATGALHVASVLMLRLSFPTETVLSNTITRNRIVPSFKDSPRKPLGRRTITQTSNLVHHRFKLEMHKRSWLCTTGARCVNSSWPFIKDIANEWLVKIMIFYFLFQGWWPHLSAAGNCQVQKMIIEKRRRGSTSRRCLLMI